MYKYLTKESAQVEALREEYKGLKQQWKEKETEWTEEKQVLRKHVQQLQSEMEAMKAENDEINAELTTLQHINSDYSKGNEEKTLLCKQVSATEDEMRRKHEELTRANHQHAHLKQQIDLQDKDKSAEQEYNVLLNEKRSLTQYIESIKTKIQSLQTNYDEISEKHKQTLSHMEEVEQTYKQQVNHFSSFLFDYLIAYSFFFLKKKKKKNRPIGISVT
ncbi:viral A-type inclusion protein [Reticulomyxa filosa]|uniref:Viral A-type inclusion protein n=1 Tax=Reticulomyxa filosa TaxID=46433 RepID=X6MJB8_RETFI|nr:viral A-type inclusion protein [Reticulomyxa filosa]|eukprot:ETO13532.1 viral A-type inclusion protein [Reticulomyxa filosa]